MSVARIGLVVGFAALVAGAAWWGLRARDAAPDVPGQGTPTAVKADAVDPANEGRLVSIAGALRIDARAVDTQLGVSTDAVALLRDVEMYQWQEQCVANACGQKAVWSPEVIDSNAFRERTGNVNPGRFPFERARFPAGRILLGAFVVDPALVTESLGTKPHPVGLRDVHPNLEASFGEHDGVLYADGDPDKPMIGDLRVSYRVVPVGDVVLTGIQRADRLEPAVTSTD